MRRSGFVFLLAVAMFSVAAWAWQGAAGGPYKVIKTAKVGGEGGLGLHLRRRGGRRLYIPRGATRGTAATDTAPAGSAERERDHGYDIDTLQQVGEIPDTGGNGVSVCSSIGHGFLDSHPAITMFDTKTLTVIKKIDLAQGASGDGLLCNAFNTTVYIYSHPQRCDGDRRQDGSVLGVIDLGGVPEQSVAMGRARCTS
jgi:hypothetical protein